MIDFNKPIVLKFCFPLICNLSFVDMDGYKKNVKSKISKEKKYCQGTGGGPPLSPPHGANDMDKTIDEKIFEIITPVAIQGNKEVAESQATFEFEDVLMESTIEFEDFLMETTVESEDVLMEMPKRTYEIKVSNNNAKIFQNPLVFNSLNKRKALTFANIIRGPACR